MRKLWLSLAAGTFATGIMTATMAAVQAATGRGKGQLPPRDVAMGAAREAGVTPRREPARDALAAVSHYAYGAAAGPLYLALPALGLRQPFLAGPVYGLLVWSLSYFGLLPQLGIVPPPHRSRPGREAMLVPGHLAWGTTLAFVVWTFGGGRRTARATGDVEPVDRAAAKGRPVVKALVSRP